MKLSPPWFDAAAVPTPPEALQPLRGPGKALPSERKIIAVLHDLWRGRGTARGEALCAAQVAAGSQKSKNKLKRSRWQQRSQGMPPFHVFKAPLHASRLYWQIY